MQQPILVHLGSTIVSGRILVQMVSITGSGILVTFTAGEPGVLINTDGVGPGVYVEFDDTVPAVPTGLAAFGGIGGAYVQWATVPFATSYDVDSSPDNSTWTTISSAQPGTSYSDSTGNDYYRVRANNSSGSSDYTDGVAAGSPFAGTQTWLRSVHGFTVSTWSDQGPNGFDATQATAGNQMALEANVLGGKSVVRCVDNTRIMNFNNIMPTNSSFTKIALFKCSDLSGPNNLLCGALNNGSHLFNLNSGQFPTSAVYEGSVDVDLVSSTGVGSPQTAWALAILSSFHSVNPNTGSDTYNKQWVVNGKHAGMSPLFDNTPVTDTTLSVGGIQGLGFGYIGDVAEIMLTTTFPNAAEVNGLSNMCNATYALSIQNFTIQVLLAGDSITAGAGASTAGGSWAALLAANSPSKYYVNKGRSGAFTSDLITDATTNLYPYTSCGVPTTCVVFAGTNDIDFGGFSGTQAHNNIKTLRQGLRANGAARVVVVTMLPRDNDETQRQILNNLLRANWSTFADTLADVETTPMGVAGANDSELYFTPDRIHPNDTGHAVCLFPLIAPLVDPTITLPPIGPVGLILTPSLGNIGLSWTESAGATGYDVQSSPDFASWTTISSNQAGTTFTDTGAAATAAAGTTGLAYYRVRADVSGTPSLWTINGAASVYPVFDSFTDVNGTLLTAHMMNTGSGWVLESMTYTPTIQNDSAQWATAAAFSDNIAVTDTGAADGTIQATGFLPNDGGHAYTMIVPFRYTDSANQWAVILGGSSSPLVGLAIYETVAGVTTQRAYESTPPADGVRHVIKIVLSGASISVSLDGGSPLTYGSASSGLSATKHGIYAQFPQTTWSQFFFHP